MILQKIESPEVAHFGKYIYSLNFLECETYNFTSIGAQI